MMISEMEKAPSAIHLSHPNSTHTIKADLLCDCGWSGFIGLRHQITKCPSCGSHEVAYRFQRKPI